MVKLLKRLSLFLTGEFSEFPMENRAFNLISGLMTLLLSLMAAANLVFGYVELTFWVGMMVCASGLLFYLSRFKGKFSLASMAFAILSYVLLTGAYFLNSGISGPIVYTFFITLILNIVITPRKFQPLWIGIHIVIVPAILLTETLYPSLTEVQYLSANERFFDHTITYIPCIIFVGILGIFLTSSYNFEKKAAENGRLELQKKNEELSFTVSEKDRLFSIIGHDLKSPLNSIRAYLEMLDMDELDPADRSFLNGQLLGLTHNASNLLNNLLNWSVRNSLEATELKPLQLGTHLKEVISLIKPEADRKNIELVLEMENEEVTLLGESEMLHLVLRNLINNAIKFSPTDTQIVISGKLEDGKAQICVKDKGLGIPLEQQSAIFGSQVKPGIGTQSEKGIGLGLVLCHDFVKAMRGSIKFQSKVNEGTEFTVTLNKAS